MDKIMSLKEASDELIHARVFHEKLFKQVSNIVAGMTSSNVDRVNLRLEQLQFALDKNLQHMNSLTNILIYHVNHGEGSNFEVVEGEDGVRNLVVTMPIPDSYQMPEGVN